MKRLVLIRHAKTEGIHDGITDFERQLEPRGVTDAREIALHLKAKGCHPDIIISSNASRALQTSQIMAEAVDYSVSDIKEAAFIYHGYTTGDFLDYLSKIDSQMNEVWVVGHNPDIAILASQLTNDFFNHFPTSSAAVIVFQSDVWSEVAARSGKIEHFVFPKDIKR